MKPGSLGRRTGRIKGKPCPMVPTMQKHFQSLEETVRPHGGQLLPVANYLLGCPELKSTFNLLEENIITTSLDKDVAH